MPVLYVSPMQTCIERKSCRRHLTQMAVMNMKFKQHWLAKWLATDVESNQVRRNQKKEAIYVQSLNS